MVLQPFTATLRTVARDGSDGRSLLTGFSTPQAFLMARWSRLDEPSRLLVVQNFTERLRATGHD